VNASVDDILRRVPPRNLEAEQSVLGAILLQNAAINEALEVIKADDFYRESHREIFRVMTELSDRKSGGAARG
jgi:replicative DNA helicase